MAIWPHFRESLQKALRSLETGLTGFDEIALDSDHAAIRAALARATPGPQPVADRPGDAPAISRWTRSSASPAMIPGSWARSRPSSRPRNASARTACPRTPRACAPLKSTADARLAILTGQKKRPGVPPGIASISIPLQAHRHLRRRPGALRRLYMYLTYENWIGGETACEEQAHGCEEDHHPAAAQPHRQHRVRTIVAAMPPIRRSPSAAMRPSWSTATRNRFHRLRHPDSSISSR